MNLHKVKGLEAPVVFLADPTGNYEHPIDLHIDRAGKTVRGYMAVYAPRPEGSLATPRLLALPADWAKHEETETDFLASRKRAAALRGGHPRRHVPGRQRAGEAAQRKPVALAGGVTRGSRIAPRPRRAGRTGTACNLGES